MFIKSCMQQFGTKLSFAVVLVLLLQYNCAAQRNVKPRILVSTDIGGTDPDDNQSMIHLLMYADLFQIEGLVSTSFITGRKQNILDMIDLYEKDLPQLKKHANKFPTAQRLRKLCKQGAVTTAPYKGFTEPTEGSDWIISCAKEKSKQPLWILVWGGLEDLAQALHDAPEIKQNIRVYWIGGPNKKWGVNAYNYIAQYHADLWIIESNATYRGWFLDEMSPEHLKSKTYYSNYIKGRGAMGHDFVNYYGGEIKMGDTPSFAYVMHGKQDNPSGESWGGSFAAISHSARVLFERNTTEADTVATYAVIEWRFKGPEISVHPDTSCFTIEISGQKWPGYYIGNGTYAVRYSPKQIETATYKIQSLIRELDGHTGSYVAVAPWPGKQGKDDYKLGPNWYSDRQEPEFFIAQQQGAKTISKYRKEFLLDWAKRWEWLE